MAKVVKTEELNGKRVASKDEAEGLRGRVVILNTEIEEVGEGEIPKRLEIKEKGVYGIRFR